MVDIIGLPPNPKLCAYSRNDYYRWNEEDVAAVDDDSTTVDVVITASVTSLLMTMPGDDDTSADDNDWTLKKLVMDYIDKKIENSMKYAKQNVWLKKKFVSSKCLFRDLKTTILDLPQRWSIHGKPSISGCYPPRGRSNVFPDQNYNITQTPTTESHRYLVVILREVRVMFFRIKTITPAQPKHGKLSISDDYPPGSRSHFFSDQNTTPVQPNHGKLSISDGYPSGSRSHVFPDQNHPNPLSD